MGARARKGDGMRTTTRPTPDRVDRALASARRAVGRLVDLLGEEDRGLAERAAAALTEVGPFAVGPLTRALSRAGSPRHRARIIVALVGFAPQAGTAVMRALLNAREHDPHEDVRAVAGEAVSCLFMNEATRPRAS
jgi:HEAT repeat protein